jgi:hypothetical protein
MMRIKIPFRINLSIRKKSGYTILAGLIGCDYIAHSGKIANHASA